MFRARDARRRWAVELAAAALLGAAAATRLEALIAAPALLAIAASGRGRGEAARAGAALSLIVGIPIAIHLASMAALGVAPARLHYVGELARKFELAKVLRNLGAFFAELSHLSPPKRNVLADLPEWFDAAQTAARIGAFALTLVGIGAFLARPCRGRGAAALALLLVFPLVHSLWHYTDGRFLLLVWPVVAAAEGRGAEMLLARAPRAVAMALAALLALAAATLLALGFSIANKEIGAWESVTGGSARALAERIDGIVGADAEGIYELEMDSPPRVASGPFVAAFRRAPARFAYDHDEFFAADVPREGVAALLGVGKRFVLTNLPFDVWLSRRVTNPAERDGYVALIQESGRTLIRRK